VNVNVEFKNIASDTKLRTLIDQLTKKVAKKLPGAGDEVFLRVLVEENAARKLYRVSVVLEVPKKTLATQEERHDLGEAIRDAFAEVERQVEAYKATVRGDYFWERRARREELRKRKGTP